MRREAVGIRREQRSRINEYSVQGKLLDCLILKHWPAKDQILLGSCQTLNFPFTNVAFPFIGAFAKLRKATVSFVMSVCLSARMERRGFHLTDFY